MVLKLCFEAEKTWEKMKGYKLIPKVFEDSFCKDGVFVEDDA